MLLPLDVLYDEMAYDLHHYAVEHDDEESMSVQQFCDALIQNVQDMQDGTRQFFAIRHPDPYRRVHLHTIARGFQRRVETWIEARVVHDLLQQTNRNLPLVEIRDIVQGLVKHHMQRELVFYMNLVLLAAHRYPNAPVGNLMHMLRQVRDVYDPNRPTLDNYAAAIAAVQNELPNGVVLCDNSGQTCKPAVVDMLPSTLRYE